MLSLAYSQFPHEISTTRRPPYPNRVAELRLNRGKAPQLFRCVPCRIRWKSHLCQSPISISALLFLDFKVPSGFLTVIPPKNFLARLRCAAAIRRSPSVKRRRKTDSDLFSASASGLNQAWASHSKRPGGRGRSMPARWAVVSVVEASTQRIPREPE